jgi:predicted XRE-type DNA-binding protein
MTKLKDLKKKWMKDPAFRREYEALEGEFSKLVKRAKLFADLGLPAPEQEALRAEVTLQICKTIKQRRLSQARVSASLRIKQSEAAALMRNRPGNFDADQLFGFLSTLEEG